jgi:hypothetical protein
MYFGFKDSGPALKEESVGWLIGMIVESVGGHSI